MKQTNKRVGIIGHFGGDEVCLDGQTIKTKVLFEELQNSTDWEFVIVDTYNKNKNPFRLLRDSIGCLCTTRNIIVLLSGNGMRVYFPLLYVFTKLFRVRIYHDVIGGNLDKYVVKYPAFKKYLNSFCVNWVETKGLKKRLAREGIQNCEVLPNFKRLMIVDKPKQIFQEPYKLCTFSRVMREKGIEDAIQAVENINKENARTVCVLDIYGEIDEKYKDRFSILMKNTSCAIRYQGTVPYDQSVDALRDYDVLLFPTYWEGEGFPGTIVDAFSAGVPVIATDWNCNSEIITNESTGLLYPNESLKDLKTAILWLISCAEKMPDMRDNCIREANRYQPDRHIRRIVNRIADTSQ